MLYSLAQFWNKELIFVANKVASMLDESHISSFKSLLLSNLALYPTNPGSELGYQVPRHRGTFFEAFSKFLELPWDLSCFLNLLYNSRQRERFVKD